MTTIHEIDREEVMALLDGELSDDRAATIRAHLDRCSECRTLEADLRRVSARLGAWQVGGPSDSVVMPTGVPLAGVATAPRSRLGRPIRMTLWAVATAAAVLVVFTVGNDLLRRGIVEHDYMRSATDALLTADKGGALATNGALKKAPVEPPAEADSIFVPMPPGNSLQSPGAFQSGFSTDQLLGLAQAAKESRMIVRAVTLSLSTDKFDEVRAAIDRVAAAHQGRISSLSVVGDQPTHRSLSATVLVPVLRTDAALSGLRALGTVVQESQSSEDVTDSHRDLTIRLANAKVEEGRLGELLARRTDKLSDVLAVEQAQSRVRGEIEQMTAEEQAMAGRAALSTITVQVEERYRAEIALGSVTLSTRFHNALVDGLRGTIDAVIDVSLTIVRLGPAAGLVGLLWFWPGRSLWRRIRH